MNINFESILQEEIKKLKEQDMKKEISVNDCNGCEDCKHCGRGNKTVEVFECDECHEEVDEAYEIDGNHICPSCMRSRLVYSY